LRPRSSTSEVGGSSSAPHTDGFSPTDWSKELPDADIVEGQYDTGLDPPANARSITRHPNLGRKRRTARTRSPAAAPDVRRID
jgi:hypothetical protein